MKNNKYLLQKSEEKPNHWVFTDEENLISIIFENRKFDETQEVKLLKDFDTLKVSELAKILKEMSDYLHNNHYAILHPYSPTDEIIEIQKKLGIKGEIMAKAIGIAYSTFRKYLGDYNFNSSHVDKLKEFIINYADTLKEN